MITGSNLFGLAVTERSRLIQFSKQIYAIVVSEILLQSLLSGSFVGIGEVFCFTEFDRVEV